MKKSYPAECGRGEPKLLTSLLLAMLSFTEEANSEHGPNHLSVFMGSTEFSGPGYEYTSEHEFFVTRLGALYEFRYKGYTLSPQFHFDYHEGLVSSKVVGLAVGFDF